MLVLGIASIPFAFFFLLGVIPGVIALVLAGPAQREIAQSGGRLAGDGLVTAGKITAWVGIGLAVLLVLMLALGFAFGARRHPY